MAGYPTTGIVVQPFTPPYGAASSARRQEAASRAYHERLRTVDPDSRAPFPPKPLGALPDFNSLHRQWEVQMARARANIRKRITVPQVGWGALSSSTARRGNDLRLGHTGSRVLRVY